MSLWFSRARRIEKLEERLVVVMAQIASDAYIAKQTNRYFPGSHEQQAAELARVQFLLKKEKENE